MPVLYSERRIHAVLRQLSIQPDLEGCITAEEVAKILSWRAMAERGILHVYGIGRVRQMVDEKKLTVTRTAGNRQRFYTPAHVFLIEITPKRGIRGRIVEESKQEVGSL